MVTRGSGGGPPSWGLGNAIRIVPLVQKKHCSLALIKGSFPGKEYDPFLLDHWKAILQCQLSFGTIVTKVGELAIQRDAKSNSFHYSSSTKYRIIAFDVPWVDPEEPLACCLPVRPPVFVVNTLTISISQSQKSPIDSTEGGTRSDIEVLFSSF